MSDQHRLAIEVPREAVGFIIGRHGETVRSLSTRSGAFIAVDESTPINQIHDSPGVFNITGSKVQIQRARELISDKVNAILFQPPPATDVLLSPTTVSENTREDVASDEDSSPFKSDVSAVASSSSRTARAHDDKSTAESIRQHHHTPTQDPPPSSEISTPQSTTPIPSAPHHPQLSPSSSPAAPAVAVYKPNRPPTEMWIPSQKVGMVIGQKGQVISGIQEKSGATIVVHNQNEGVEGSKLLTISGNQHNRQVAKGLIDQVLNRDQRNMAATSSPSSSVGRRGRNSSYARNIGGAGPSANRAAGGPRLSERTYPHDVGGIAFANRYESVGTGTQPFGELVTTPPSHVSPHPFEHSMSDTPPPFPPPGIHPGEQRHPQENTLPINLNIPPPGVLHPSFYPPQHPPMVPTGPYAQLTYGRAPYPQAQMQMKPVCVPTSCVGIVIGKGGETIRDLQSRSGAYIKVTPDREANSNDKERRILITGPPNAVELAHNLLNDIVNEGLRRSYRDGAGTGVGASTSGDQHQEGEESSSGEGSTSPHPVAPGAAADSGAAGSNVGPSSPQALQIDGEYRVIQQPATQYPSTSISIELSIPNAKVGVIIGKGGQTIRELQQKSGARIVISKKMDLTKEDNPRMVTITGPSAFVEMAHALIHAKIRGDAGSESGLSDSSRPVAGMLPPSSPMELMAELPTGVGGSGHFPGHPGMMTLQPRGVTYFQAAGEQGVNVGGSPIQIQAEMMRNRIAQHQMMQHQMQQAMQHQQAMMHMQQQAAAAAAFQQQQTHQYQQQIFGTSGGPQQHHSALYPAAAQHSQHGIGAGLYPSIHQAPFSPQQMMLPAAAAQVPGAVERDEMGSMTEQVGNLQLTPQQQGGPSTMPATAASAVGSVTSQGTALAHSFGNLFGGGNGGDGGGEGGGRSPGGAAVERSEGEEDEPKVTTSSSASTVR